MFVVDLLSANETRLAQHDEWLLQSPMFSPDEKHVLFYAQNSPLSRQILVLPFTTSGPVPEEEWIPVTDGSGLDREPRWSADGKLIYFLSERDGFRCIWAVPA
jgi:Tol biopolymer transport system component